jgi:hypothetical protein
MAPVAERQAVAIDARTFAIAPLAAPLAAAAPALPQERRG